MGVPRIAGYVLPTQSELPAARPAWTLEAGRAALLIHDMQRYFLAAFAEEGSPIPQVIDHIASLREQCGNLDIPVFYTAQPGDQLRADRGLQAGFWGPGMTSVPEHRDVVSRLAPRPGDIVLEKWRYSAFQRTNLEHLLRARGRDQLIITGVFAHIGCVTTAADAFMRDVQPFLVADGMAAYSRATHDLAVNYAAGCCAIVTSTNAILKSFVTKEVAEETGAQTR
jgi:bifunctional isochorismate lyase / aryl carrier protein